LRYIIGLLEKVVTLPMKSVYPSAGARATRSAPIIVLAPGALATMTGWPSFSPMR
jgi:hypothetical protein